MKIKEKVKSIIDIFKKIYKRFPISMITITIETLLFAMLLERRWVKDEFFEYIVQFGLTFVAQTVLIEAYYEKNTLKRTLIYCISGILSLLFTLIVNQRLSDIALSWVARITISYCLILLTTTVWVLFKKTGKTLEKYSIRAFENLIKTGFIYFVLSIGVGLISLLFIYLILNDEMDDSLIWRLEILLFGLYFIPNVINSFTNVEQEEGKFIDKFVKYVLGTLIFAAFLIIYMYMIKIFAFMEIPSNQIFRILASLFILGLPVWTMIEHNTDEETTWKKVCSKLPIAFIPFIILQIYSMGVRVLNYGFTPLRYIGVMLIIFEIVYILMYLFKKEKISNMIIVFNILVIITAIIPFVNMFDVSNISQYNILKLYKEKEKLTSDEKEEIYGAYNYLAYSVNGKKYINNLLNTNEINEIKGFRPQYSYYGYNSYEYIYGSKYLDNIDIQGYRNMRVINAKEQNNSSDIDNIVRIYINEYEKSNKHFQTYFENNNEWIIDGNRKLIIEYISIRYDDITKEIEYYDIDGYILEK